MCNEVRVRGLPVDVKILIFLLRLGNMNGLDVLDTSEILLSVLNEKLAGKKINDIALAGQKAVSVGLAELAIKLQIKLVSILLVVLEECFIMKQ